jgi:hypothetical protein
VPDYAVQEFINDEKGYLAWLKAHPEGLVLNAARSTTTPSYLVLHRATCPEITTYTKSLRPGGFTAGHYIKICGPDVASLHAWAEAHGRPGGSFTGTCSKCEPDI